MASKPLTLKSLAAALAVVKADVERLVLAIQPVEPTKREVQVTAAPAADSVQVSWSVTDGEHVTSFLAGRDGTDATGYGPWTATLTPDSRGNLFLKLRPAEYTFDVVATYADGEVVKASAKATPTGAGPVVVEPSDTGPVNRDRLSGLPWESGAFTHHSASDAAAFAKLRAVPLDHAAVFTTRDQGWDGQLQDWWKRAVPKGAGLTIGLPLWPKGSNVGDVETGKDDENWRKLARQIAAVDEDAWVRLAWEMNIGQYWKITPQNRAHWLPAWRRAATVMLEAAPKLRIGWNPNAGKDQTGVNCREVFEQVADLCTWVGPDSYDAWPALVNDSAAAVHRGYLDEYLAIARKHGIKLAVPEWGVAAGSQWAGHQGGDNPRYIEFYLDYFGANASAMAFESYFSEGDAYLRSTLSENAKAGAAYRARLAAAAAA